MNNDVKNFDIYIELLERHNRLKKHTRAVYGAYIILALANLLMIFNFYLLI